ncbi:MAG: type IV-A pilus assembly ATPase PilB, partial [Halomonas sp.]
MSHSAGGSTLSQAAARGGQRGIAQRLIKHGLLSEAQAAAAVADSLNLDISLLQHVVERELVTPAEAAVAAGYEYGLPVINLESVLINALPPAADYPVRVLQSLNVVPLA